MSPELVAVGMSLIISLIIVGIFFLSDDHKEIIEYFRNTPSRVWRECLAMLLILAIYNLGGLFGVLQYVRTELLWYPYIFGGMPSYAVGGVGKKWWNQIQITLDTTIHLAYANPFCFIVFIVLVYWLYRKWISGKKLTTIYSVVVIWELFMIVTTDWNTLER